MVPHALVDVGMSARTAINEAIAVIDDAMLVTMRVEIPKRRPAISDYRRVGFMRVKRPSKCQRFYPGRERETVYRLALNTDKHPLPLERVAPMIYEPT
jgi:hypothetical protein